MYKLYTTYTLIHGFVEKSLDKLMKLCYNIGIKGRWRLT